MTAERLYENVYGLVDCAMAAGAPRWIAVGCALGWAYGAGLRDGAGR